MSSAVELKGWKDLEVRCDNLPGKIREALKDAITSTVSDFAVDLATGPLSGGSLDVRTGKTRRAVKAVVSDKQASITGAVWIRSNAAFVTLIGQQHETKQHLRRAPSADLKKKHFGRISGTARRAA
ncbi:MAG: hypothetical protein IPL34_20520 [Thiofilum sp.]|uniref:hypothetical protein n=1 Tax=Thiofilum sp. TaxID=2212733 RepID=UPI0025D40455|nr:hypothetical protein [Thiofilum sp.]MBK8455668.1 hypothetical protein [Thiofilum sp.]